MFFDPTYMIFMIPAFLLMMIVQGYVNHAYNKWSKVSTNTRMTGAQAAQRLIQAGGLYGVQVAGTGGQLTDHYDPRDKTLYLSQGVYNGASVAALAVSAHELGHAMQDQEGYMPLRLRAALVPAVNIGSYLGWILIFAGLLLRFTGLAWAGVLLSPAVGALLMSLSTVIVALNAQFLRRLDLSQ
jgi:Zn-dependent membrane protease YugP